jgi:flagellar export protein FliJ
MKKFQFRLDRLLRYHQQRLKQVELRLFRAARERDAATANVALWQQQIESACQSKETAGSLINPTVRTNLSVHLDNLGKSLAAAREHLQVAQQRFREIEQLCAEVNQSVEGLTQLRSTQQQEHRDEVNRLLQIDLDEFVMRNWSARNG